MKVYLIEDIRKRQGLTQSELAESIGITTTGYQKMISNKDVKVYTVKNKNNGKVTFAVSGDVWGLKDGSNFKGFAVNDKVIYKKIKNAKQAKIIALKDDNTCFIQIDGEDKAFEVPYSDLTKAQ